MHAGLLRVNGAKMGKSNGNFTTIRDALATTDYRTLRYAFLSQHYRSPMELNETTLDAARNARHRVENFARLADVSLPETTTGKALLDRARMRFLDRLGDDFDTPGALAALFEFIREQNRSGETPGQAAYAFLREVDDVFDAFDFDDHRGNDTTIEAELEKRRELRKERKFAEADEIRNALQERGILIEDTPSGTRWWYRETHAEGT